VTLIGLLKEKLLESRIKDNAVHAGPSPLSEPSKVPSSLPEKPKPSTLSKNSSTALDSLETTDVREDGWTLPSNTSSSTD